MNNNYSFINNSCYNGLDDEATLLQDIRELEFAAIELNLYLDTHPKNIKALRDYNCISKALIELKQIYDNKFGQLSNFGYSESTNAPWKWTSSKWPWE